MERKAQSKFQVAMDDVGALAYHVGPGGLLPVIHSMTQQISLALAALASTHFHKDLLNWFRLVNKPSPKNSSFSHTTLLCSTE